MIAGDRFPPVVVFQSNTEYLLADGFHRLHARRLAKFERIDAEVRQGTRLDALKFSLSANHQHGLRRTNEDKRHAVEIALREFPEWSDQAIAQMCGVSHPSVGAVRRELVNFTSCGKRLGRDGKHRKQPVKQPTGGEPYTLPGRPDTGESSLPSRRRSLRPFTPPSAGDPVEFLHAMEASEQMRQHGRVRLINRVFTIVFDCRGYLARIRLDQ